MKTNNCCLIHEAQEALLFKNNKKIQHEAHKVLLSENNKKTQLKSWLKIHEHKESDCVTWYNKNFSLIIFSLKRDTVMRLDLLAAWDLDRTLDSYLDHSQDWLHEYDLMMWILKASLKTAYKVIWSILVDFTVFTDFAVSLRTVVLFVLTSSLAIRLLTCCSLLCFLFFSCNVLYTMKIS